MKNDLELYIAQRQAGGWKASTIRNCRQLLTPFIVELRKRGCRRFADVGPADLDAYMAGLEMQGRTIGNRIRSARVLRLFFAWLQDRGRILGNPAKQVPVPFDGEEDLPDQPLSEGEVAELLDGLPRMSALDLRNACLMELLYGCGLRISEAIALDGNAIDLRRRTVLIRESKHGQTRVVPLPKTAVAAVKCYLALRRTLLKGPDHGAFFLSSRGRRWQRDGVYGIFRQLNERRGRDARHLYPHLLRHSIAVHLLRGGADIRYIQQFLGHASLDTTKIYLRLVPGQLKEDYESAMPEIAVEGARSESPTW